MPTITPPRGRAAVTAVVVSLLATVVGAAPAHAATVTAIPVATGLSNPAAFTFAPDGRVFYGERFTGELRVRNLSTGADKLYFTVNNLATTGEEGLLGIALDPDYPTRPDVYVYATRIVGGSAQNQILRIKESGGVGASMTPIYTAPAAGNHNGGRILFGPDKKLYAVVGDRLSPSNSQDLTTGNTLGKVLRMTTSGGAPGTNPFSGSLTWAYGIRNSFGFTFDPQTDRLWETENGPECNDEINRIAKGRNYGWGPNETCSTPPAPPLNTNRDGPNPVLPLACYTPTTAPTGAAFCDSCGLGSGREGHLFYGTWNTGQIREITPDAKRAKVASENRAYSHSAGILSVERSPNGSIYFSDTNAIYRLSAA